jgi:hypothetical protein
LNSTTTFSLSCSGTGGASLKEITVEVTDDDRVRVVLSVDRELILANDQVEITWNSMNATSCEASGAWSGDKALSGTATSQPIGVDATFKLTCFKTGASGSASIFVTVADRIVEWQAPKKNVDGTPLKGLDGFNLYWGARSRSYNGSVRLAPKLRRWEADLPAGTYYFAITAIDKKGKESGYSNEIIKQLP